MGEKLREAGELSAPRDRWDGQCPVFCFGVVVGMALPAHALE